ncbi:MAG: P-II family nitrogen regulator [Fibrobacteria bacterium]|nr:P-II family nitrogen regulator [Fibrobacteria bacterium]
MKLIIAYIKPFKLDEMKVAVQEKGVKGITLTEVKGFGRQKGHTELYRGSEYKTDFIPKLKVEMVVEDEIAEAVIEAVVSSSRTGKMGDGKVFQLSVEKAVRVRTGECGEDAL